MSNNPDPAHITDAMWRLWEECAASIPGVRLGGIYANKSCYHNTVSANQAAWPGVYCVRLPLDLTEPSDKARAIDLTMSDEQMILRTGYLKASALDPDDDRLRGVREFIGTLDCQNVACYIKDTEEGPWRWDGSRDDSHLWHIHISVFTKFCGTWDGYLDGVLSVLRGESYDEWSGSMPTADEIARAVWDIDYVPSYDEANPTWQGKTVLGYTMDMARRIDDVESKVDAIVATLSEIAAHIGVRSVPPIPPTPRPGPEALREFLEAQARDH